MVISAARSPRKRDDDPPDVMNGKKIICHLLPLSDCSLLTRTTSHDHTTTPDQPHQPKSPGRDLRGAAMRGSRGTRLAWLALLAQRGMHSKHARVCVVAELRLCGRYVASICKIGWCLSTVHVPVAYFGGRFSGVHKKSGA